MSRFVITQNIWSKDSHQSLPTNLKDLFSIFFAVQFQDPSHYEDHFHNFVTQENSEFRRNAVKLIGSFKLDCWENPETERINMKRRNRVCCKNVRTKDIETIFHWRYFKLTNAYLSIEESISSPELISVHSSAWTSHKHPNFSVLIAPNFFYQRLTGSLRRLIWPVLTLNRHFWKSQKATLRRQRWKIPRWIWKT